MGILEQLDLTLDREAIIKYLEDYYYGKFVLFHNPLYKPGELIWYTGIVNRINVEIDAESVDDCTVTLMIGHLRVETSVLTFIHNTQVRHGNP